MIYKGYIATTYNDKLAIDRYKKLKSKDRILSTLLIIFLLVLLILSSYCNYWIAISARYGGL